MAQRTLLVVGGASGVGKSTSLSALSEYPQLNTGDYFKRAMAVDRDSIKGANWIDFEDVVADSLSEDLFKGGHQVAIVDTHFSAKVFGKRYRIGLRRSLIHQVLSLAFTTAESDHHNLSVTVVLIGCDPYSLLTRRRLDVSRKRDLYPADCVRALSENNRNSVFYLHEAARARSAFESGFAHQVRFVRIENIDLATAQRQLRDLVEG